MRKNTRLLSRLNPSTTTAVGYVSCTPAQQLLQRQRFFAAPPVQSDSKARIRPLVSNKL